MIAWTRGADVANAIAAAWNGAAAPGGAIALFGRDGLRAHASGGLAQVEHRVPFTVETPNRLASISKHMLAAQLVAAGIDLDAPLGVTLQGLPEALASTRLGRALDMTAGIPDLMEVLWQQGVPFTASLGEEDLRRRVWNLAGLNAPSGTEMVYSNTGWRLGQLVLSQHLGLDYATAVDRFMSRLGLAIRFVGDESDVVPGLAAGYWHDGRDWRRGRYGLHFSASGGMVASVATLAGWGAALLAQTPPLAGALDTLSAPRRFDDGRLSAYRLGLVETALDEVRLVGHGGSLPGYRNHLLMAPALGVGVAVLTNREEDALWPALCVLAALVDKPLPATPRRLPVGLFAAEEGPVWAETTAEAISFMGGYERLVDDGEGGLRSLPAYLEMRLRAPDEETLEGLIGGVRRRLTRVPRGLALDPHLVGRWRERRSGTEITLRADASAELPWAPLGRNETSLTPLPGARALADLRHGPWRHRPCVSLQTDGSLRLASHRARILHYEPIEGVRP